MRQVQARRRSRQELADQIFPGVAGIERHLAAPGEQLFGGGADRGVVEVIPGIQPTLASVRALWLLAIGMPSASAETWRSLVPWPKFGSKLTKPA
jgi:hypothetical protein